MSRAASTCSTSALTPSARKDCCDKFYSFVSARDRPLEAAKGGTEKLNLTGRPDAVRGLTVAASPARSITRLPARVTFPAPRAILSLSMTTKSDSELLAAARNDPLLSRALRAVRDARRRLPPRPLPRRRDGARSHGRDLRAGL